ncbi:hypothetical protein DIPPA_08157 [Diplonema papillatum]|nr:hypothetical protein DIPPA_08157 [Diplonema papillatum]
MMSLGQFWEGRVSALQGGSDGTTNVFEALGSLEAWQQGVADLQYKRIRQVADEEWSGAESSTVAKRRRVLHVVVYEAWAAGLYDDDEPAGFVSTAAILTGLTYGSLLECAMMDGIDGMPSEVPVKFRSAAKKWFRCSEQREKERDARRDDQRAARAKDQPLSILDVADQVAVYGLVHLPKALTPSHTDLNSFQRRVEREPDVALPYVDISKDPYTPATAGWTSRGPVPFVHTVCALHRFLVIASLTGAFGTQPWPVIFGYPALVGDLAAKFGCAVAREYDEKVRRSFASVRRAAPRTPLLIEAVERLLTLDEETVMSLHLKACAADSGERPGLPQAQQERKSPLAARLGPSRSRPAAQPRDQAHGHDRKRNGSRPEEDALLKRSKTGN